MSDFRITTGEIAGSVGNFGTVMPIIFGVAIVADVNLGIILLFFAAWYAISGLVYRIPMSIEPMKVIGAIVIAEGLSAGQIAASGILIGIIFLGLGLVRGMGVLQEKIPECVIRGIQLGLALVLLKTSLRFILDDPVFAALCIAIIVLFFFASLRVGIPDLSALTVVFIGIGAGVMSAGLPAPQLPALPSLVLPAWSDFTASGLHLVLPQIPLTLTNAILATSLLAHDLYRREIPPDRLSSVIGVMNLVSTPLGGFPMCHGAGGLAAHYRFGARTGAANIIGAFILLGFAVFFANPAMITIIPMGIFGALLVFVAIELSKHGRKTDRPFITASMAVIALIWGMTAAFIWGVAAAYLAVWASRRRVNGA